MEKSPPRQRWYFSHRNERYNATEYGVSIPIWFPSPRYVPAFDDYATTSPRLFIVVGRIGWIRRSWHLRFGVQ
jgi:hypothetical protein